MKTAPILAILSMLVLPACSSVNMPSLGDVAAPFRTDVQDIPRSPRLSEAPVAPADARSDAAWDSAAKTLMAERAGFATPVDGPTTSASQIEAEIAALQAEVSAYQVDDPVGGARTDMPDITAFELPARLRQTPRE